MDPPSMETASTVVLYGYAIVVVIAVADLVAFPVLRRMGRIGATMSPVPYLSCLLFEYVGNTNWPGPPSIGIHDRRRNDASRVLVDHVLGGALARDMSPPEVALLAEELRQAIRSAEQVD